MSWFVIAVLILMAIAVWGGIGWWTVERRVCRRVRQTFERPPNPR